jgi:hypothetical protein
MQQTARARRPFARRKDTMLLARAGRDHISQQPSGQAEVHSVRDSCITPPELPVSRVEEPAKACPACLPWIGDAHPGAYYSVGRGLTNGVATMTPRPPHRLSTATSDRDTCLLRRV